MSHEVWRRTTNTQHENNIVFVNNLILGWNHKGFEFRLVVKSNLSLLLIAFDYHCYAVSIQRLMIAFITVSCLRVHSAGRTPIPSNLCTSNDRKLQSSWYLTSGQQCDAQYVTVAFATVKRCYSSCATDEY